MLFFSLPPGTQARPDAFYEDCIGKMAGGDRDALAALYAGTKDAVYGFALSFAQNAQEAEDILQDTFVSVYASAGRYRKMGKPMAWILTITKNLALMRLRDQKRTADLPEEAWASIADAAPVTGEDKLTLQAALGALTPESRRIVLLHAVAGCRHREIAALLELPLSTVLSKYNRAIKKLKSVLEEGEARDR